MFKEVNINEIKSINKPFNLIDIRNHDEVSVNMIDNATHIEMMSLLMNPAKYLNKDEVYYLYCASGIRSCNACMVLDESGYQVVNLLGGIKAYQF